MPSVAEAKSFLARLEQQARAEDSALAVSAGHGTKATAYRWGRLDRRTLEFQPPHRSGDAAIWESDDLMARRVRNQVLNQPQLKRVRDAVEDLIVGPGILTFADPFHGVSDLASLTKPALDGFLSYALEADDLFEEWFCEPKQFDLAGKRSGPEVQRMLIGESAERGGCLLVRTASKAPGRLLPLCYQIVEYDQLDHSKDRPSGPGQNKIVHGIELDADGREVAFHIYDDHPFDDFAGAASFGKSSKVSAARVIHTALFRRPSQSLGVTWTHALAQPAFDREKFLSAEITAAAKAALLLLIHKMANFKNGANLGLDDGSGETTDSLGNEEMKLGANPLAIRIHADDEVELVESVRPNDKASDFINLLDHDLAGAAGLSFYTLTGKYENTSFSSARAAKLDEDGHFRPLQDWAARLIALPIRRAFHEQAIGLGLLSSVSAQDYLANPRKFNRFDAIGPGRDLLDPEAETNAAAGLLRTCLSTLKAQCAKRGLHYIRVLRQIALENHILDVLGIVLDLSKGQGGQTVGNTRSKEDQEAAQRAAAASKNTRSKGASK